MSRREDTSPRTEERSEERSNFDARTTVSRTTVQGDSQITIETSFH